MDTFSIGIDLGGTRIKSGLVKNDILLEKKIIDAESNKGLQSNLRKLEKAIDALLNKYEVRSGTLDGIALAFPGIVNPISKKIISTNKKYDDGPQLDLEGWVSQKWSTAFYIENDARMATVGEWKFGAGRGSNDVVAVTIGTGIGSSAIIEGRLLRGKHFQAGCLGGHFTVQYNGNKCTCGNIGCVEAQASTWNISKMIKADPDFLQSNLANERNLDFHAVFKASQNKDPLAIRIKYECLNIWSAGIINLIHAYDPEVVVLGGGIMNSKEEIIPYIQQRVDQYAWCPWGKVQVRASELMDDAAILGVTHCLSHSL
ncbi:MAG TPA: ROK family protein [Chitinophagaceae bacterium]|nr:ROK family protein [Chitinophagaceae bacterium]